MIVSITLSYDIFGWLSIWLIKYLSVEELRPFFLFLMETSLNQAQRSPSTISRFISIYLLWKSKTTLNRRTEVYTAPLGSLCTAAPSPQHCLVDMLERKEGNPPLFKQNLKYKGHISRYGKLVSCVWPVNTTGNTSWLQATSGKACINIFLFKKGLWTFFLLSIEWSDFKNVANSLD